MFIKIAALHASSAKIGSLSTGVTGKSVAIASFVVLDARPPTEGLRAATLSAVSKKSPNNGFIKLTIHS